MNSAPHRGGGEDIGRRGRIADEPGRILRRHFNRGAARTKHIVTVEVLRQTLGRRMRGAKPQARRASVAQRFQLNDLAWPSPFAALAIKSQNKQSSSIQ
jgi:hypothetical protein